MEKVHIISQTTAGRTVTLTGLTYAAITQDNILGIINETQSEPLYTPMDLGNITNVTYSSGTLTITLASTVKQIEAGDKLFVKLLVDDDYAKQGTNPNATLSAVLEALQGSDTPSPDIPEGVAERLAMILEHFGIKTISGYEFMTDTEVCDELEDIMRIIDPNLTAAQAAAITAQTLNPSES